MRSQPLRSHASFLPAKVLLLCLAALLLIPRSSAAAQDNPDEPQGFWQLVDTSTSQDWEGDRYHGLESNYSAFNNYTSMGATYTQLGPKFTSQEDPTKTIQNIQSELSGTCQWVWDNGDIPAEIVEKASYPYTLNVTASDTRFISVYENVTATTQSNDSINNGAMLQAKLDPQLQNQSDSQSMRAALALSRGQQDGETRTVTLTCLVDIVTVKTTYTYRWKGSGCTAAISLPADMKPKKDFTPSVAVTDNKGKTVSPIWSQWYLNGNKSNTTMRWDGKEAVLDYEFTCPGEKLVRKSSITIPAAPGCISASIVLPKGMEPEKTFTPKGVVLDIDSKPVKPADEKWFLNNAQVSIPVKWDGKEAALLYEFTCPVDGKPGTASVTIPPFGGNDWSVVFGGLAAVAAAALVTIGAGAALAASDKKQKPPKYILQVDKKTIALKKGDSEPLTINVWRTTATGALQAVPDAQIQVTLPGGQRSFKAAPLKGTGSLVSLFSAPDPKECAITPVKIDAKAGTSKVSATVNVNIIPKYELKLEYHDQSKTRLKSGKEIYAWAMLTAVPMPDKDTTLDTLAKKIKIELEGSNKKIVQLKEAPPSTQEPYVREGKLWIPLSLAPVSDPRLIPTGVTSLKATFKAGTETLTQKLTLNFPQELMLGAWVRGQKSCAVIYDRTLAEPRWDFADIILYFHEQQEDKAPVVPDFEYKIDASSFHFSIPALKVADFQQHAPHQYTCTCELKRGQKLETYLGDDLKGQQGRIDVDVDVKTKDGRTFSTYVSYNIKPQLELFARLAGDAVRDYRGLEFKGFNFLADGTDQLKLLVTCRRPDQGFAKGDLAPEPADPSWYTVEAKLAGDLESQFSVTVQDPPTDQGYEIIIKANRPELYDRANAGKSLKLELKATATSELPNNYHSTIQPKVIDLKPHFLNLHLWVVPGKLRGTSEAWVYAHMDADRKKALADLPLSLEVSSISGSGASLVFSDGGTNLGLVTSTDGSVQANLLYEGLNWDNHKEARFTVACALAGASGQASASVSRTIDVGRNVRRLLADFMDSAGALKLNNPYYENRTDLARFIELTEYRTAMRGPVWNFGIAVKEGSAKYLEGETAAKATTPRGGSPLKFIQDYACSSYRDRISRWLVRRRHYNPDRPDRMEELAEMNGIEFENMAVAGGLHRYSAIFLSGMQPVPDARGLDPWWHQSWKERDYLSPDGLMTDGWERAYCLEFGAWFALTVTEVLAAFGLNTAGIRFFRDQAMRIGNAYTIAVNVQVDDNSVSSGSGYFFLGVRYAGLDVFLKDWKGA